MMFKWVLLALYALTKPSMQSIAGVTYMDEFDVEERYTDPNKCNPFYWHPLHLPEDCAELYDKAIRSKVAKFGPVRIMTKKPKSHTRRRHDRSDEASSIIEPGFEPAFYEIGDFISKARNPLSPYEQMLDNLREDISYLPTAPRIASVPGYGPVAFYQQPISKTSKNMIQNIAKIYGKYNRRHQYPYPYVQSETILKYDEADDDTDNAPKEEILTVS